MNDLLKVALVGAGGFAVYKLFIEPSYAPADPADDAAKQYIALYKQQMAADSKGDTETSLSIKMQLDDLKERFPNMPLYKYV